MKKVIKIILIVIASIVLLGAIFGTVDYIRAKNGKKPMFAYRNVNVNDEGYFVATEYYGLGYAIVICNKYCDKNVTFMPLYLGGYAWFIGNESGENFEITIKERDKKSDDILLKELANSYIESEENVSAKIYSYGLDEIKITKNGETYLLEEALRLNKVTIEEIIEKLEYDTTICYCNGKKEIASNGQSILYTSQTYNIRFIKCNTLEGNKDIYIGNTSMKYEDNFCK